MARKKANVGTNSARNSYVSCGHRARRGQCCGRWRHARCRLVCCAPPLPAAAAPTPCSPWPSKSQRAPSPLSRPHPDPHPPCSAHSKARPHVSGPWALRRRQHTARRSIERRGRVVCCGCTGGLAPTQTRARAARLAVSSAFLAPDQLSPDHSMKVVLCWGARALATTRDFQRRTSPWRSSGGQVIKN